MGGETETREREMNADFSGAITLGAQTSADDNRSMPHVIEMRRVLAAHCPGPYSPEIDEFALVLRVGGLLQEFDFEGCSRLRRNRKQRYITVDLGFPLRRWRGVGDAQIREFISESVQAGILCCLKRLEKDQAVVDAPRLLTDLAKAQTAFLSGFDPR